ncbi:phage antirepressor KilAC domain-containing protein [Mitsuokella multacida]|uniref:Phage regulatory protein, Rha family n=1 Tax=Mitsuokella multacida DSM 20544 TaxID=500635 RepID=C9KJ89_9FIRM|nr:phage antirepressor KilAC domain-containing protein [Mitsuokella multacida]EEX69955.1 phage regulatory protein, Rha family [Mitsuokella multacida DSM 20544]
MNDLVISEIANECVLDSRRVAEMIGKTHAHLCRDIDGYIAVMSQNPKLDSDKFFIKQTYTAGTGKQYKRYDITKMGCEMVANKLTGQKGIMFTAKYVEIFNKMAEQIIEERTDSYMITDPVKRAKKWIEEETERQKLRAENKEMLPKAQFYDTVANTESLFSMADVAKTLDMGIGRNKLFAFLRNKGILDKDNHPYQKYVDAGYLRLVEDHCKAGDNDVVYKCTYVKQKGIDYIRKILLKERELNEIVE